MTQLNAKHIISKWNVVYNPYSDLFQIFDKKVFFMDKNDTIEKKDNNYRIIFKKKSYTPIMFEVKEAYSTLGVNIDSLNKTAIIDLVEPFISSWLQKLNQ